ncbi:MAG: RsmB/NOP family class I SAM-dependent RNA methyltransferase, partial [Bacilli bacterium]
MDFKSHLLKYLKKDEIDRLMNSLTENDRHAVLLNPHKMNDNTFVQLFPHVIPHPLVKHAYLYDKNEYELGKTVEHELGAFYLQEPSAMVVSSLLDFQTGDLVLDLCAAPGGKTVQASFLMDGTGLIVANDIAHNRAMAIKENVERLGLGNVLIISNDFSKIYHKYKNIFDKIILDAPCSGSGMFRKDKRFKEDWTYAKVLKNQALQKELILM